MENVLDLSKMDKQMSIQLNEIAKRIRKSYTNLIDYLSRKHSGDLYWWVTPLASRNTYLSDAFLNICTAILAQKYLDKNKKIQTVIVNEYCVKCCLEKYCAKNSLAVKIKHANMQTDFFSDQKKAFYQELGQIYKESIYYKKNQIGLLKSNKDILLIDTFLLVSDLINGKLQEQYFPNLDKYLQNVEHYYIPHICWNTNSSISIQKAATILSNKKTFPYILKEAYLTKIDFLKMSLYPYYCKHYLVSSLSFQGLDIADILNHDLITGINSRNSIQGLMGYFFIQHLYRKKIKISSIIHWYEGQPSTLGMSMAYRRYYPHHTNLAYNSTTLLENVLSVYPSEQEYKQHIIPNIMTVIGKGYIPQLKQFCPKVNVHIMPSFRSQWIYSFEKEEKKTSTIQILVALPYFKPLCLKIIQAIIQYQQTITNEGISFYIKNHPYNKGYNKRDYKINNCNTNLQFIDTNLIEALQGKQLLISGASAIGMEIISLGIPIILFEEYGKLSNCGIPSDIDTALYQIVYDAQDLQKALSRTLKKIQEKYPFKEKGERIKEKYFEKVDVRTRNALLHYIGGHNEGTDNY